MRITSSLLRIVYLLALIMLGNTAWAAEQNTEVTIAAYKNPPWYIANGQGKPTGIFPSLAQKLSDSTPYNFTIIPMPYQRVIDSLDNKNIDLIASIETASLSKIAIPYINLGQVSGMICSNQPIDDILEKSLNSKITVGILRGGKSITEHYTPPEYFKNWDIIEFNSEISGLHAVALGRIDATIVSEETYKYAVEENPLYADAVHSKIINSYALYGWIPKDQPVSERLKAIRDAVESNNEASKHLLSTQPAQPVTKPTSEPTNKANP